MTSAAPPKFDLNKRVVLARRFRADKDVLRLYVAVDDGVTSFRWLVGPVEGSGSVAVVEEGDGCQQLGVDMAQHALIRSAPNPNTSVVASYHAGSVVSRRHFVHAAHHVVHVEARGTRVVVRRSHRNAFRGSAVAVVRRRRSTIIWRS